MTQFDMPALAARNPGAEPFAAAHLPEPGVIGALKDQGRDPGPYAVGIALQPFWQAVLEDVDAFIVQFDSDAAPMQPVPDQIAVLGQPVPLLCIYLRFAFSYPLPPPP